LSPPPAPTPAYTRSLHDALPIFVDDTADLEAAAEGIAISAYGFQGQKCSAASRAIVLDPVYQDVLGKVASRAEALRQGPAEDPSDRKSTRLNSSHSQISYAVFCL